jgi:hypothetical protein
MVVRVKRHYIKESHIIRTKVFGEMTAPHLFRHLCANKGEAEGASDFKQLIDFREVGCTKGLTVHAVTEYAKREPVRSDSLLALLILDNSFHFGMARAYQTFVLEKRKSVEIFKDVDSAEAWLQSSM